jgi:integral membrane protein (TIGR01906 family)
VDVSPARQAAQVSAARIGLPIVVPVVLVLTAVRLLLTPAFVRLEYRMPGFPEDPYGFTREQRLRWAMLDLEYLLNDAGIEFLGDLRFEDGTPVHNERELRHMEDVKRLTQAALRVWFAAGLLAVGLAATLWIGAGRAAALEALAATARLTLILMAVLLVLLVLGFSAFFVGFHRVFFVGDTWLFPASDTLIRLYPVRFWRDAFLFTALATLAQAGILWGVSRWISK